MLIDTHCHINMIVKKDFDVAMNWQQLNDAQKIIDEAFDNQVTTIINVGTSIIESKNCIALAQKYTNILKKLLMYDLS